MAHNLSLSSHTSWTTVVHSVPITTGYASYSLNNHTTWYPSQQAKTTAINATKEIVIRPTVTAISRTNVKREAPTSHGTATPTLGGDPSQISATTTTLAVTASPAPQEGNIALACWNLCLSYDDLTSFAMVNSTWTTPVACRCPTWPIQLDDVPEASEAGEAGEAADADEAKLPFGRSKIEADAMCRQLCDEGWTGAIPIYRYEKYSPEGKEVVCVYCQDCEAHVAVQNVTETGDFSNIEAYLWDAENGAWRDSHGEN